MQIATSELVVKDSVVTSGSGSTTSLIRDLENAGVMVSRRHLLRLLDRLFGITPLTTISAVSDAHGAPLNPLVADRMDSHFSSQRRIRALFVSEIVLDGNDFLVASDRRGERWWSRADTSSKESVEAALSTFRHLVGKDIALIPHSQAHQTLSGTSPPDGVTIVDWAHSPLAYEPPEQTSPRASSDSHRHLDALEAESIRIIRESVAVSKNPAMLFSMGKDSMVMLTLARKAFWPEPVPFPLVMIDTRWKFRDMYRFRQWIETRPDLDVMVHVNPDAIRDDINPFDHGSAHHTDVTKTLALKQILDKHGFDYVFGGARRDEEKSRAKERVFSVRSSNHGWDPKNQRPELWNLYNSRLADGQSMRVFPISNWTELDVWRYVEKENLPVVPLYFSKIRPFVERNGSLIMVDDDRFRLEPDEKIHFEPIRFRTLGCYPLTGGVRSEAKSVADIISELEQSRVSERSSRVIDFDAGASMEQKKKEGYF